MRRLLILILLALPVPGALADEVEVDLKLVLAADISRSMSVADLTTQRQGYAAALTSPEVLAAVRGGFLGRIALTYVEWSGADWQRVVVDWTLVESEADARAVADVIAAGTGGTLRRTSISQGLSFARDRLRASRFSAPREVVDISGDGPNNQGPPVTEARDALVAEGVTINGLPIMTTGELDAMWAIDRLDLYYRDCVIGGPGAFVVPVRGWDSFATAVRRKLVLEISGLGASGLRPAQAAAGPPADCLIGEKIWQRRRGFDLP